MTRARGLTLVELALVIALTLILASVAIKGLSGVTTWRAAAAVNRVQADLQYARNLAVLSTRRTWCVFDLDNQSYEIQQEAAPGSGAIAATVINHPLTGDPWAVALQDLSSGLTASSDDPAFGFSSYGLPVDASGAWVGSDGIEITFSSGATLTIVGGSGLPGVTWP